MRQHSFVSKTSHGEPVPNTFICQHCGLVWLSDITAFAGAFFSPPPPCEERLETGDVVEVPGESGKYTVTKISFSPGRRRVLELTRNLTSGEPK